MINIKNNKGSVSLYVMLAMLFFLMFVVGAYTIVSHRNQVQIKANTQLKSMYAVTNDELKNEYTSKFAKADDVIPISNAFEFALIGTGNSFETNGKVYVCDMTKSYQLTNDIIIDIDNDIAENSNFAFNEYLIYGGKFTNGTIPKIDSAGHEVFYFKNNSFWKCLVYQNTIKNTATDTSDADSKNYFANENEAKNCNRAKTFSKLEMLSDNFKNASGKFEFLLMYDANQSANPTSNALFSKNRYNRWQQSQNPILKQEDASVNYIDSTSTINLGVETGTSGIFKGLLKPTSKALLNGDFQSTWLYAVATYESYYGGIPGDSTGSNVSTQCLLFVKVPAN